MKDEDFGSDKLRLVKQHPISESEIFQAMFALLAAVSLQILTALFGANIVPGAHYFIVFAELVLAALLAFSINVQRARVWGLHHLFAIVLLGLITVANVSGLIFVLNSLIVGHGTLEGEQLLASAVTIFLTNIIVFALWYWEIDSPGLTNERWSKNKKDFQFTQQDHPNEFKDWQPQFGDYLYLSVTNAVNFAPADSRPITLQAKLLMASQALISVFTLALVLARSVSILGS